MSLSGKVAVVTGSSRGIGFAIAQLLLRRGAHVVVTATREQSAGDAAAELRRSAGQGARILHTAVDVRDYASVERLMQLAVDQLGGLDILVNNAGIGLFGEVSAMPPDDWRTVIDTNVTGVFYCCRAALPYLRRRADGWIVNISSLASKNPFVEGAAYCASKSALNAFSEVLMQEVRHDGIRVAYVLPGSVRTEFSGHSRENADWKLAPEDVALTVADLLDHPSRSLPSRIELRPSRPPKKAGH